MTNSVIKRAILIILISAIFFFFQCPAPFKTVNTNNDYSHVLKDIYDLNENFGELSLSKIALLGSHDCLSDKIDYSSKPDTTRSKTNNDNFANNMFIYYLARGLTVRLARAQSKDVYNQLKAGSRFLDIRITDIDGEFYNTHGLISDRLDNNLNLILKFLDENPGEFVIFNILYFYQDTKTWDDLCDYISSIKYNDKSLFDYVNYDIVNETDFSSITYNDVTNNGNNAGVIILSEKYNGELYNDYFKINYIYNESCKEADYNKIDEKIDDKINDALKYDDKYLKVNQSQITPDIDGIISVLYNWSLINISDKHNDVVINSDKFNNWLNYMPIYLTDNVTSDIGNFNTLANENIKKYNASLIGENYEINDTTTMEAKSMNNNLIDMKEFTAQGIICILSLMSLAILIKDNNRLGKEAKSRFYRALLVIAIAALSGWLSLLLNGRSQNFTTFHAFVKSLDYCFFPLVCVSIADLINYKKYRSAINTVVVLNAIFELLSIFTKWSFFIDETYVYKNGPLHFIYEIAIYATIGYLILGLISYGKKFKKENIDSLISILVLLIVSVVLQEVFSVRVMFIGMAPAVILLYIHLDEFNQLQYDEDLEEKNKLIATDALTGLGSRFAYNNLINYYTNESDIPNNMSVIEVDINGLKETNDTRGHVEGDKIICATANIINDVFSSKGKCFRTGGDEYFIFIEATDNELKQLIKQFKNKVNAWSDDDLKLSVSLGYVRKTTKNNYSIEKLIKLADESMYKEKRAYYMKQHDRRRRKTDK